MLMNCRYNICIFLNWILCKNIDSVNTFLSLWRKLQYDNVIIMYLAYLRVSEFTVSEIIDYTWKEKIVELSAVKLRDVNSQ